MSLSKNNSCWKGSFFYLEWPPGVLRFTECRLDFHSYSFFIIYSQVMHPRNNLNTKNLFSTEMYMLNSRNWTLFPIKLLPFDFYLPLFNIYCIVLLILSPSQSYYRSPFLSFVLLLLSPPKLSVPFSISWLAFSVRLSIHYLAYSASFLIYNLA